VLDALSAIARRWNEQDGAAAATAQRPAAAAE
jgi:hypothetical protein